MILADLHIHSRFSSDGEFSVEQIATKCRENGIQIFSISDHNSVKANQIAVEVSEKLGIDYIPAIEIDCSYNSTNLHLLGYNINWRSSDFDHLERDINKKVMDSFSEMIHNINGLGFVVDAQSVLKAADGNLPTAELIAEVMLSDERFFSEPLTPYMKGGVRSDMPYINFYLDYFAQGKPAFVEVEYMSYEDAIALVRDNGGVPIVAHHGLNFKGREQIAEQMLDKGAEGLEVFNNYHSLDQIDFYASLAQRKKALITCGSDFHGQNKPLINVGQFKSNDQYDNYLKESVLQLLV